MFNKHVRTIFCACLAAVFMTSGSSAKDVSINFIANASLRITDGEYVLFTDFPYVSGAYDQMVYEYPYFVEQDNNVTTLITNRLTDHFDPDVFMTLGWKVIAPSEVVGDLQKRYLELNEARDRVVAEVKKNHAIDQALSPNSEVTLVLPDPIIKPDAMIVEENQIYGPMQIKAIRTKSGQVEHYSYLLDWGGKKIYLSGETGDTEHLSTLPETDIAFMTPWLFENARKENTLPKTKKIVIYQHAEGEIVPNCFDCTIPVKGEYIPFE